MLTVSKEAVVMLSTTASSGSRSRFRFPEKKKSKFRLEDGKLTLYFAPRLPLIEMARVLPDSAGR